MPRGTTVELSHIDYPQNMQNWPLFHNGVANGLRISTDASNIDSTWIVFNKPAGSTDNSYEHAGFLMALGLNRHLTNLSPYSTYEYLHNSSEMTGIGVLLGKSPKNPNFTARLSQNKNLKKPTGIYLNLGTRFCY